MRFPDEAEGPVDAAAMRGDCGRCAGLCCIAFAFDRSADFAIDKPNDVPCPHLEGSSGCRIHSERMERGFRGCVAFDCYGAGQRVTQELFGGRSWHDEPAILAPMMQAFRGMRVVHELLLLLSEARKAPLSPEERATAADLWASLQPPSQQTAEWAAGFPDSNAPRRVRQFLTTLERHFRQ